MQKKSIFFGFNRHEKCCFVVEICIIIAFKTSLCRSMLAAGVIYSGGRIERTNDKRSVNFTKYRNRLLKSHYPFSVIQLNWNPDQSTPFRGVLSYFSLRINSCSASMITIYWLHICYKYSRFKMENMKDKTDFFDIPSSNRNII